MLFVNALLRVFQRSWRPMVAVAVAFAAITFVRASIAIVVGLLQGNPQAWGLVWELPVALVFAGLAGCCFGLWVGILGKSVRIKSGEGYFKADPLGIVGALIGCLVGGYLGYQDQDNVVRVVGYELDSFLIGINVGLTVGGLLGAILGEVLFPSTKAQAKAHFEAAYADKAPWDIGKPQPALVEVADQITGSVLDAGCGTGENALFFAQRGNNVTGIDYLDEPIKRAKQKAAVRGLPVNFLVRDALALQEIPQLFDNAIDSGLFHVFSDDDRKKYVEGLATVLKPGGRLFILCFSDEEPAGPGPRRITKTELQAAFTDGWEIESITPTRFEASPDFNQMFSAGGPKAWFVVVRHA